jgi:hypothetical protein
MHTMRKNRPHVPSRFDPEAATALAVELRKEGFSLCSDWGAAAEGEADSAAWRKWHPAQVAKLLLTDSVRHDRAAMSRRASELRAEGMTLKEIGPYGSRWKGIQTRDGGIWHPASVHGLLVRQDEQAAP